MAKVHAEMLETWGLNFSSVASFFRLKPKDIDIQSNVDLYDSGIASVADTATATATETVSVKYPDHPIAALHGLFDDDPMWQDYLEAIKEIREQEKSLDAFIE